MLDVRIRIATPDDAGAVAAVLNSVIAEGSLTLFDTPFTTSDERRFLESLGPRSAVFVAELEGSIAGVQSLDIFSAVARSMSHVATMGTWLRADTRGRGIGHGLAMASFEFASQNGYSKIVIQVLAHNARALRFYRRLGFVDIGVARDHVQLGGQFYDEVYLEKALMS